MILKSIIYTNQQLTINNMFSFIPFVEKKRRNINWCDLSKHENAIDLLEKNPDKINNTWISENPNAVHLLSKYPDKIDWKWLW